MQANLTGPLMQMFTEADNYTQDLFRYLALIAIVTGLGLEVYSVAWVGRAFDIQTFGIGVGALFVGMGAALRLKAADSQPGVTTTTATATTITENIPAAAAVKGTL